MDYLHPERVILFGSYASGVPGPDSDVDLLVVLPDRGARRPQVVALYVLLAGIGLPKDIVVATPEDIERFKDVPGTIIWAALQAKGTRSAKRHLRKLAGKVNRFRRDCDHVLSRRIVESVQPGTVIVVENLVDIRTRAKQRGRESRRRLHSWSFAQLRGFLSYKAEAKGCRVVGVDPRRTSQMCSCCGYIHRSNRRSQSRFLCRACGFELNADLNAARNIARKYLAGGGMTAAGGPPSTGLSRQPACAG